MPALAHELARLVGPFHVKSPFRVKARVAFKSSASNPSCSSSSGPSPSCSREGSRWENALLAATSAPAGAGRPHPVADASRRAYRIGAGASQSEAKPLFNLPKSIKSFRFLSRVLDR
jgi:hypothetical protein